MNDLSHDDQVDGRDLQPHLVPDLFGRTPGEMDDVRRLPFESFELQGLYLYELPCA